MPPQARELILMIMALEWSGKGLRFGLIKSLAVRRSTPELWIPVRVEDMLYLRRARTEGVFHGQNR